MTFITYRYAGYVSHHYFALFKRYHRNQYKGFAKSLLFEDIKQPIIVPTACNLVAILILEVPVRSGLTL